MKHIALYGVGRTMKGVALVLGRSGSRVTAISPTQDNATMLKNEVISYLEDGSCPEPFLPDDLLHEMRDYQKCIDRIDFTSDLTAVSSREIQMVIEVLPDDLVSKRRAVENLHKLAAYDTIIATHSESLRAKDIFAGVPRKDRLIGVHFVHPIATARLVELAPLADTSQNTLDSVIALVTSLRHSAHICKDEPGLLVNRLVIELLKERKRIVQDKTATVEEVDDIFRIAFRTDLSLKDLEETLGPISIQRLLSRRP